MDGVRSASRTIQNNLLDGDKQEAYDLLVWGAGRKTDLTDRTRLLLPPELALAPAPLAQAIVSRAEDFTYDEPLRVAVGTYNINGGKHFRSVVYKNVSLDDWLLDCHTNKEPLIEVEAEAGTEEKVIDIYAIGFEEMVDLDAKNIMNASKENAKEWALELGKTLNRQTVICIHQILNVVYQGPPLLPADLPPAGRGLSLRVREDGAGPRCQGGGGGGRQDWNGRRHREQGDGGDKLFLPLHLTGVPLLPLCCRSEGGGRAEQRLQRGGAEARVPHRPHHPVARLRFLVRGLQLPVMLGVMLYHSEYPMALHSLQGEPEAGGGGGPGGGRRPGRAAGQRPARHREGGGKRLPRVQ